MILIKIFRLYKEKKNKKISIKNELVENYINMDDEFERNCYSRTAKGNYEIGQDGIKIMKWIV